MSIFPLWVGKIRAELSQCAVERLGNHFDDESESFSTSDEEAQKNVSRRWNHEIEQNFPFCNLDSMLRLHLHVILPYIWFEWSDIQTKLLFDDHKIGMEIVDNQGNSWIPKFTHSTLSDSRSSRYDFLKLKCRYQRFSMQLLSHPVFLWRHSSSSFPLSLLLSEIKFPFILVFAQSRMTQAPTFNNRGRHSSRQKIFIPFFLPLNSNFSQFELSERVFVFAWKCV